MTIKRIAETRSRILRRPGRKTQDLPSGYTEHVATLLGSIDALGYVCRWEPEDLTVVDTESVKFQREYKVLNKVAREYELKKVDEIVTGPDINNEMRRLLMLGYRSGKPEKIKIQWEPTLPPQAKR